MPKSTDLPNVSDREVLFEGVAYSSLMAILSVLTSVSAEIMIKELSKILMNKDFAKELKIQMMPYLYAAGFLSFAGREITESTISSVMKSIGITPDPSILDLLSAVKIRTHLIYVYAFYYLLANGRETSPDNIIKVVESLGMSVDDDAMIESIKYIKSKM